MTNNSYNIETANSMKALAERKLMDADFTQAKDIASRALALYPRLSGLSQLLATTYIFIAAQTKINGEVDWYTVLGLDTSAHEDKIRQRCREIAHALFQPYETKAVRSAEAFAIVSQARSILCDRSKRMAYDARRQKFLGLGLYTNVAFVGLTANDRHTTFWTKCGRCGCWFKYERKHLDGYLPCRVCNMLFRAVETQPPLLPRSACWWSQFERQKLT